MFAFVSGVGALYTTDLRGRTRKAFQSAVLGVVGGRFCGVWAESTSARCKVVKVVKSGALLVSHTQNGKMLKVVTVVKSIVPSKGLGISTRDPRSVSQSNFTMNK